MIVIPRRITKRATNMYGGTLAGLVTDTYHYEYVGTSRYVVIYRCLENGTLECFRKLDFLEEKGCEIRNPFRKRV